MLLGTGIDMIRIGRIQSVWSRYGERFLQRVYTEGERSHCLQRPGSAASLAVRFAAKEAVFKALPDARRPLWREIEVVQDARGQPGIRFHGETARLFPGVRILLSLSHDGDMAIASALAEASPSG